MCKLRSLQDNRAGIRLCGYRTAKAQCAQRTAGLKCSSRTQAKSLRSLDDGIRRPMRLSANASIQSTVVDRCLTGSGRTCCQPSPILSNIYRPSLQTASPVTDKVWSTGCRFSAISAALLQCEPPAQMPSPMKSDICVTRTVRRGGLSGNA